MLFMHDVSHFVLGFVFVRANNIVDLRIEMHSEGLRRKESDNREVQNEYLLCKSATQLSEK